MFAATTLGNTSLIYQASTSTDPTLMISLAFVETNHEILESLLRYRRRHIRNEELRTELGYRSKDYDEEPEIQCERVVGFEEVTNREGSRTGRNTKGNRPSKARADENGRREINLPPLLAALLGRNKNGQPLQSSLTFIHGGYYPLPDGLKMTSYVGSYDGKGNPDNFLHLFEGAIRMQKWLMPVVCHMFTYTLKDSTRIWWNSQKAVHSIKQREGDSVRSFATRYTDDTLQILVLHEDQRISGFVHGLRTRNLVEHLSTNLSSTYKGLMEKTYTWIEAREVATNETPNDQRDNFECPREILAIKKVARSFEQPPRMLGIRLSRDMSKYFYFHEDHGHDSNDFQQLRSQIEEVVKSGQLSHLVKGIKKERAKTSDSQWGEKKEKSTTPAEVDSQVPLVRFWREKSWAIGEVLLKITIGNAPLTRSETLNFVIVRSNSIHYILLGRTAMQKIRMVVSTIHRALKFHTTQGIRTVFSTHESDKIESVKKVRETSLANTKEVLGCTDAEEKIIVNSKYPE
ncbi:hypothetical protein Tco_0743356 [Tanacetum coccineum]